MGNRLPFQIAHLLALALICAGCASVVAQDPEKPKLKDFGSSLKRFKWDDKQKAAVEKKKDADKIKKTSTPKAAPEEIDVVKVETSLVSNDVLVLDARGNFVPGLTDKDFVITEDGLPQQVGMLSRGDDIRVSRSIVLILDHNIGLFRYMKSSLAAAKALVDKLPSSDSMAIVTDSVELIQDFTKDKQKLKSKLDLLLNQISSPIITSPNAFGTNKSYSALFATLNEAFNNGDQRPIVIFQSEGAQLGSLRNSPLNVGYRPGADKERLEEIRRQQAHLYPDFSLDDICRAAEKARATVYSVIPGYQLSGRTVDEQMAIVRKDHEEVIARVRPDPDFTKLYQRLLKKEQLEFDARVRSQMQGALATVATSTGGWTMFLETPDDADQIYSSILSDINRRYIVGYYPTNKEHDGKRRKLELSVRDHPDYTVVGRKWYYAPSPD